MMLVLPRPFNHLQSSPCCIVSLYLLVFFFFSSSLLFYSSLKNKDEHIRRIHCFGCTHLGSKRGGIWVCPPKLSVKAYKGGSGPAPWAVPDPLWVSIRSSRPKRSGLLTSKRPKSTSTKSTSWPDWGFLFILFYYHFSIYWHIVKCDHTKLMAILLRCQNR